MRYRGAAIGMLIALALSLLTPTNPELPENFLGLMLISFGSLGLGLGVGIAIAFDLISARRAKRATANRVAE